MDPVSLGLGAFALTIQLFGGLMKGFAIFETASRANEESEQCKLFLRIEYEKLEQWGILVGLDTDEPSHFIRRNGTLAVALLYQLSVLLKSLRKRALEEYSDEARSQTTTCLATASMKLADISGLSQLDSAANVQQTKAGLDIVMRLPEASPKKLAFRKRCMKIIKNPKSLKWAVIDMPGFQRELEQVQQLVSSLTDMLSHDQMASLIESTNSFKLMLLQLATDVTEMKSLQMRSIMIDSHNPQDDSARSLSGTTLSDRGFSCAAATEFSIEASNLDPTLITPLACDQIMINGNGPTGTFTTTAGAKPQDCWVEWKSMPASNAMDRRAIEAQNRVKKLVALLGSQAAPQEFCVLKCLGYIEDVSEERFGLVFELPLFRNGSYQVPRTLRSLYTSTSNTANLALRVAIAQKLSQCLLYLQAVNWLHKGLRSESILLFGEKISKDSELRVGGFESSRLAINSSRTTGPSQNPERLYYTHPRYFDGIRSFRKSYDIYSLGVILVELAYWSPIEEIVHVSSDSMRRARTMQDDADLAISRVSLAATSAAPGFKGRVQNIRKNLLDDNQGYLRHVEDLMGGRYRQATEACLTGLVGDDGLGLRDEDDQNQTDPSVGAMIQQAFIERVVEALKSIVL